MNTASGKHHAFTGFLDGHAERLQPPAEAAFAAADIERVLEIRRARRDHSSRDRARARVPITALAGGVDPGLRRCLPAVVHACPQDRDEKGPLLHDLV